MQLGSEPPIDANAPDVAPTVTEITAGFVREQRQAAAARGDTVVARYESLMTQPAPYRVGPNDVLSITIWDHPELIMPSLTYSIGPSGAALPVAIGSSPPLAGFAVSADGEVQLPYAGLVNVLGLTEIEIQKLVKQRLSTYIRNPQISVRVAAFLSQRIYVAGEVKQPGMVAITGVAMTLPTVLAATGGILESGDESRIVISRKGQNIPVSLPEMLAHGVNPTRLLLQSDDIVRVLPRENFKVVVVGEVMQPRTVSLRNDGRLTLSEALGEAGGGARTRQRLMRFM